MTDAERLMRDGIQRIVTERLLEDLKRNEFAFARRECPENSVEWLCGTPEYKPISFKIRELEKKYKDMFLSDLESFLAEINSRPKV